MLKISELKKYYSGKKVLITGHTGFKGSYMCVLLKYLGAKVYGYSLKPEKGSLYELLKKGEKKLVAGEMFADIRDIKKLKAFVKKVKPDYVLHMAAQPLVLKGYEEPRYTYEVNVMGTVNLMEAIRQTFSGHGILSKIHRRGEACEPISILNVTTDKVYENNDLSNYAFKEHDKLCGRDPYANSKSCSELVTYAYEKSFFSDKNIFRISTARAGNVIGGGDLNENRIIPDCYRSIKNNKDMVIRNPKSIRPYQFVLEPLILYLNIMAMQKKNKKYEGNYNIGPDKKACLTTEVLTKKFFDAWAIHVGANAAVGTNAAVGASTASPHESKFLRLDNSLIKKTFNYKEIFDMDSTMKCTTKVYSDMLNKKNIYQSILDIVKEYTS
ncbi:MAG: CDP-glucose 4,6-dehydratase [Lachnospiraceae bacterium]|nr:CDP-glucose 4,6-dehydratase [Lachnospiraceae bacterium]